VNDQPYQPGEHVVLVEPGASADLGSVVEIEEDGTVVVEWRSGEQGRFNPKALERWVEPDE
jgi:hypothetical protein